MTDGKVKNNLGVIFHWGLYSVPAYDSIKSAKKRKMQNGSEWYLKRLKESGNYRPISGYKETQKFHEKYFSSYSYEDFAYIFAEEFVNFEEWMKNCVKWGASYVILTSKHHDGFCLWDTKTTDYSSQNYVNRNLIEEFVNCAKKYGLKAGIYYSLTEFGKGCTKEYTDTIMIPQLTELLSYEPNILWLDGHWDVKTVYSTNKLVELLKQIPSLEINDRISHRLKEEYNDENHLGISTFRNYSDRHIPEDIPSVKWEHINTLGYSWGYNVQDVYKSKEELLNLYETVSNKNGRFLINIGPDRNGVIPKKQKELMDEIFS